MNKNNSDIMLSIIVPTYGHEKYISQALDSILMQKTKYKYEVLVGEDASPDGTRNILKQYEKDYPGVFTMFYRDTNMRSLGKSNAVDLRHRAKGKYLISLEGDDYWTDEQKIEKQVAFLENHSEYIAVAHNCVVVDENSEINGEEYPECKENQYTFKHYMYNILPGQTTTVMYRNYYRFSLFNTSILEKRLSPGDRLLYFALISHGKVYCIQEKMSAYRHVLKGGTSFTANYKFDYEKEKNWYCELLQYAHSLNNSQALRCAETVYFGFNFNLLKHRNISLKTFTENIKIIDNKFLSIVTLAKRKFFNMRHKINFN